jgi:hypothetical protein
VIRELALVGLGFVLLTGCAAGGESTPATPSAAATADKRIAVADLRSALLTESDLPGDGWRVAGKPVTIGQSDGRSWLPADCGMRFTKIFDTDLAPPADEFVTVTYEQASDDDFRVVTENISGWQTPPDVTSVQADFSSLITDCQTLTSDQVTLTMTPLDVTDAAAIRITYGAAVLNFNLDIAYATVGPYLIGVTNTGVATTSGELNVLLERAVGRLQTTRNSAPALAEGVTPA